MSVTLVSCWLSVVIPTSSPSKGVLFEEVSDIRVPSLTLLSVASNSKYRKPFEGQGFYRSLLELLSKVSENERS